MAKKPKIELVTVAMVHRDRGTQMRVDGTPSARVKKLAVMVRDEMDKAKKLAPKGKSFMDYMECPFEDIPVLVKNPITGEIDAVDHTRTEAYKEAGCTLMHAIVREGNLDDAKWLASASNKEHLGLARSDADTARAVDEAILNPRSKDLTDEEIADHVGVHRNTVVNHRRKLKEKQEGSAPKAPKAKADKAQGDSMPTAEEIAANAPSGPGPDLLQAAFDAFAQSPEGQEQAPESDQPQVSVDAPIASPAPEEAAKPDGKSDIESQLLTAIVAAWPNATRTSDGRVYFKRAQVEIIDPLIKELMP